MTDRQPSIFSSYMGGNKFSYCFSEKKPKRYNYVQNTSRFKRIS